MTSRRSYRQRDREISIPARADVRPPTSLASGPAPVPSQSGAHVRPHITVCICTFRRPTYLKRLLEKLQEQSTGGLFSFSAVVCDNDATQSAAPIVSAARENATIDITYCCEPRQNIALARNKALEQAHGDFVAFIDDDEFPVADWLQSLLSACDTYGADGVLGPVRPHFESPPPELDSQRRVLPKAGAHHRDENAVESMSHGQFAFSKTNS